MTAHLTQDVLACPKHETEPQICADQLRSDKEAGRSTQGPLVEFAFIKSLFLDL
jgi:hypothetical protein